MIHLFSGNLLTSWDFLVYYSHSQPWSEVKMSHFESKVCSRCGGSGHYSFNLMHGTKCYGCNGSGVQFTKRGLAAKTFFENSLTLPASELKVGMAIKEFSYWKNFSIIQVIDSGTDRELGEKYSVAYYLGPEGDKQMIFVDTGRGTVKYTPECRVRIMHSKEEKDIKIQEALAYQDTLNKNGTVKKCRT